MLSRQTAYYGLLACLVSLLALGSLPHRIGKLAAEQRGPAERAPGEEPGDEERESEQRPEEVFPIRNGISPGRPAKEASRLLLTASLQSRGRVSCDAPRRMSAEHAARNGVGGPLRL